MLVDAGAIIFVVLCAGAVYSFAQNYQPHQFFGGTEMSNFAGVMLIIGSVMFCGIFFYAGFLAHLDTKRIEKQQALERADSMV